MIKPVEMVRPGAGELVGDNQELEFERLFERYTRPITSFFARRGFSREECLELTQETFLGVYKGMDRFRRDSSVETWLFTIAANVWRNEVRSRTAEKRDGQEISIDQEREDSALRLVTEVSSKETGPLDGLLAEERRRRARKALEDLPPQMRRCLELRIDQQLKYREIAEVLQVSIETVKSQLFQARERLKEQLNDN